MRSILDAPCGDFNWMKEMAGELSAQNIRYIGADIVSELIRANEQRYAGPGVAFIEADVTRDQLPKTDLILCRDCLIHLSNRHIRDAMNTFRTAGARYLLTNSFKDAPVNRDIVTGSWRLVNLERPPFDFPPPLETIEERSGDGKFLGLWELEKIPS